MAPARDGGHGVLVCGTCGAPLNVQKPRKVKPAKRKQAVSHLLPVGVQRKAKIETSSKKAGKYKKRKRKSIWSKMLEEAFDVVEDIFD
ncbi:MAG: hypothetical protein ACU0AZ_05105 [Paracoccaceae bacterium]|jgi:hypothetical protein